MKKISLPEMKDKFLSNKSMYLLWIFIALQAGFIIYLNLFESSKMIDYDGAKLYKHAMEIWNKKTLFVPDWKYITTMELDCSLLPAALFYGITGNIFLAFGLSNIILIFAFAWIIYKIVSRTNYPQYAVMAISLVLIPYEAGMLAYFNMMFFNGAQYGVKVLLPLLFLLIITTPREQYRKKSNIFCIILYTVLLFITSLSSGIYVMMCGIAPLILALFLDIFLDGGFKKYKRYHMIICGLSILAFLAGSAAASFSGITAKGNTMLLTKAENMQLNVNACLLGLFQVINAVGSGDVLALSLKGITSLLKVVLTLSLLFVCCYQIRHLFTATEKIDVKKLLSILLPWNLIILIFIDTRYAAGNLTMEYRYYLIAFIPLMLLLSIQIEEWLTKINAVMKMFVHILIAGGIFIIWVGCGKVVWEYRGISQYANDICDYVETLDQEVDSVFFLPDEQAPEMCRLIDDSRTYCSYSTGGGLVVYDYYQSYIDRSSHGDKNLLLVYEWETPDMYLPYYISRQYEKIGAVRWFHVYYSDTNMFDSTPGFPTGQSSIDYFYTPGYTVNAANAVIDDDGILTVNGNDEEVVNSGPLASFEGICDIELFYETDSHVESDIIGVFEIHDAGGVVYSEDIPANASSMLIENFNAKPESPSIHIKINSGVSCKLGRIEFSKK